MSIHVRAAGGVALVLLTVAVGAGQAPASGASPAFEPVWDRPLDAAPAAEAAADGGRLFVPLRDGTLVAVSLHDGRRLWSAAAASELAPAAGDGLVFVASGRILSALDATTGRVAWQRELDASPVVPPFWDTGWLALGLASGETLMLRATDGALLWRHDPDSRLSARPAIAADRIYLPLVDGRLVNLDLLSGTPVWDRRFDGEPGELLALDDRLFFGAGDNFFYCVDPLNGRVRWRWRVGASIVGRPAVDEERVYFAALDHLLRALARGNGHQRWRASLPGRPLSGPVVTGGHVLVAGVGTTTALFGRDDGARAGSLTAPAELAGPPVAIPGPGPLDDFYVVATGDARLLAYQRGAPGPSPSGPLEEIAPSSDPPSGSDGGGRPSRPLGPGVRQAR